MSSSTPCRLLEWDSRFFKQRIASFDDAPLDRARLEGGLRWCREHAIDCVYLLCAADDAATTRAAQEQGFRVVDVRVTLDVVLQSEREPARERTTDLVRPARASDVPALRALAATSHTTSRFYNDGRFDARLCDELYATWIENSVSAGFADVVLVAEEQAQLAGYLTCKRRDDGAGEIGLVAVAPFAQGHGIGRALVERGLAWFRERRCARASVVTQGNNVRAQRLYQSAGFRTADVRLWHHRWLDARERDAR